MLSRSLRVSVLALGICLLAASVSEAQPGRGGQGRGGFGTASKSGLISNRQIQEELKISTEQVTEIQGKIAELRRKQQAEIDALVAKSLSSSQNKRLDEIIFQQQGAQGLAGDAIAKQLGLSSDQTKQIKAAFAARDEARTKLFASLRGGGNGGQRPDFNAMREKMQKITEDAEKEALAVLTSSQKSKLESLRGKKFELQRQQFGGGRGGAGGRPGGGRPQGGGRPGGGNARPRPEPDV